jgi:hypothetical protein
VAHAGGPVVLVLSGKISLMPRPLRHPVLFRLRWLAAALALLTVSVASIWTFPREYRAAMLESRPVSQTIADLPQAPWPLPGSFAGQRTVLVNCDRSLRGIVGRLQHADVRRNLAVNCSMLAEQALMYAPTDSAAHLVRATSMRELGRDAEFQQALLTSHNTAPREEWLALRRLDLAADAVGSLHAPLRDALREDVLVAMASGGGRDTLAAMYLQRASIREFLADAAESADAGAQRSFLAALERRMARQ